MSARISPVDASAIENAAVLLARGELVAFPTETVYGLGADARNPDAVRRIFAAKGRPADHPVIVHVADIGELDGWVRAFPPIAQRLAQAFWPGPLTLILPRHRSVHDCITGGQDSVGIRMPVHPVARELLRTFGRGIAAPSANRFGRISPTTAQHVADDLGDRVTMILDGGACAVGIESTIVACTGDTPVLLRPGGITLAQLQSVIGAPTRTRDAQAPRASGTLASHYAPCTPSRLVSAAELAMPATWSDAAVLARTVARPAMYAGMWIDAPEDATRYAHDLYANLRALDAAQASILLIEAVPDDLPWVAVRDRLARATHASADDSIDDLD
jgi:L-threonylcarbamoyladenylate synthase